jgi:hypothetical protein
MKTITIVFVLAIPLVISAQTSNKRSNITIQFLATSTHVEWKNFRPGHTFFIIQVSTEHKVFEQAYGFYPHDGNKNLFVGVKGILIDEITKEPDQLSEVTEVFTKQISFEDRDNIYKAVEKWNELQNESSIDISNYNLFLRNCTDFIDHIAKSIRLKRPNRALYYIPESYIRELKRLNSD